MCSPGHVTVSEHGVDEVQTHDTAFDIDNPREWQILEETKRMPTSDNMREDGADHVVGLVGGPSPH